MPLSERLRSFLDSHHAEFTLTTHPLAFTAREVAIAEHRPAQEIAKTVVVFADGAYYMIVIPASRLVDLQELRTTVGFQQVRLATEDELGKLFPDCELGAMPPLGPIYGLTVYLDGMLAAQETIAFNGCTHRDEVHMRTAEFRRLIDPRVISATREVMQAH
jgi:Ala-tRNA(Pro) deacylase